MNKETFINTGTFTSASRLLESRPDENLHHDCTDVVVYDDGHYIQLLKSGSYFYESKFFKSLDLAEDFMWEKINNN